MDTDGPSSYRRLTIERRLERVERTRQRVGFRTITDLSWRGWRGIRRRLARVVGQGRRDLAKDGLYRLEDESVLRAFAPDIIELGIRMQQDDRPVIVGPWVSELGFEVLYWIPFVKWFVERFSILPHRLVFVSRGGMGLWYARKSWGEGPRYIDVLAMMSPEEYRKENEGRWLRWGGQKQHGTDPFESSVEKRVVTELQLADSHRLHPQLMYEFFKTFWTHSSRIGLGAGVVLKHAIFEPLPRVPPWGGAPLPESFVAVKFYDRPSLPRTAETAAEIKKLILRMAETRPVVSLDTSFDTDDHSAFPLPEHPNVISAREWMVPETNIQTQTQLLAAADFFVGTYGGTAYMPAFVDTPAIGLYTMNDINFAHQHLVMRASSGLGRAVTLLKLDECSRFAELVAGDLSKRMAHDLT